jgi:hypothetical protein
MELGMVRRSCRDVETITAVRKLWKNDVPSKLGEFGWRLLQDKLTTRAALASKGIISNNSHALVCAFCFNVVEDNNNLFFSCHCIQQGRGCYGMTGCRCTP